MIYICPWVIFLSRFCNSSLHQLIIPKLYISTGTANDPIASVVFLALNSLLVTNLSLFKYSLFRFSFLCSMPWLSCVLILVCFSQIQFCPPQMCFLDMFCSGPDLFFKQSFAYFYNPKFIVMSLLIAFKFLFHSPNCSHFYLTFSSHTYKVSDLLFFSFPYTCYPQPSPFISFVNGISAKQKISGTESPPGIFLFVSEWVDDCISSRFDFK